MYIHYLKTTLKDAIEQKYKQMQIFIDFGNLFGTPKWYKSGKKRATNKNEKKTKKQLEKGKTSEPAPLGIIRGPPSNLE